MSELLSSLRALLDDDGVVLFVLVVAPVLVFVVFVSRRRRLDVRGARALQRAVDDGQHLPPSLHPVIDSTLCIGSFSCVKACPEGDLIGVVDGVATLVRAADCIGHGRCATECPVGAISLVMGTAERGVDLPETSRHFESSRAGVFVVGELGGMGLIKNALRQGVLVVDELRRRLPTVEHHDDSTDVVVVGAGPAGLACAAACRQHGLRVRVLEQESVGGAVAHYPRGKVVMTEQVTLPFVGRFGRTTLTKEELLVELQKLIAAAGVVVDEGQRVVGLDGDEGAFVVRTEAGLQLRTRSVVLACGLRGTPRRLGVRGEDSPRVRYRLGDPAEHHGEDVVVVGGGDSAIEAALQLVDESSAKVTLVCRGPSLSRARAANRARLAAQTSPALTVLVDTDVDSARGIDDVGISVTPKHGPARVLAADTVIVCAGGELPGAFLDKMGVSIRRLHGERTGHDDVDDDTGRRRLAVALWALGGMILSGLAVVGADYYATPLADRTSSPMHELLRPAGVWGHGVGIIATVFMLANFLYAVRKRWRRLKGVSTIRTWLTFHMFVGVMSPLVIAFHAAFLVNNLLAAWTWLGLSVVVGTGVFGRFLFGLVPHEGGRHVDRVAAKKRLRDREEALRPALLRWPQGAVVVEELWGAPAPVVSAGGTPAALWRWWQTRRPVLAALKTLRKHLDGATFAGLVDDVETVLRARVQLAFFRAMKRAFRAWLVIHVVTAIAMVGLIAAHVGVTVWLGYRWIWS
ncbi:MAG TPA: NAD(P)-binding domain-containing protein [Myxococcota bacterium]